MFVFMYTYYILTIFESFKYIFEYLATRIKYMKYKFWRKL